MRPLLALAALAVVTAPAAAQPGAVTHDPDFEARIMFETVVDGPGPYAVRAVWKAPANAVPARSIAFGRGDRLAPAIALAADGPDASGTGEAPAPRRIGTVRVAFDTGTMTVQFPRAGWEEGVAAARVVFEPNGEVLSTIEGDGEVRVRKDSGEAHIGISLPETMLNRGDLISK